MSKDMSNGIKMRSAKDRHGRSYTVEELQRLTDAGNPEPDLLCDDPACGCNVRFVSQHKKNLRGEPVEVSAYIRLDRKSEHVAGCRYNAAGRLKIILAQSDPEFLKALDDGKRELRLLALHNELHRLGLPGNAPMRQGADSSSSTRKTTTAVFPSEKRLDSYLCTTTDLLALRARCESDAFLAAELVLRLGTKRIPWPQFFFEHGRFDEAWEFLAKGGNNPYPIALAGQVESFCPPPAGAHYETCYLNCRPQFRETDNPLRKESFRVSIAHPDAAWLGSFPKGSEIIMLGLWTAIGPDEKSGPIKLGQAGTMTYVNHTFRLSPKFKGQIVVIT
jgi:hypothetical protein